MTRGAFRHASRKSPHIFDRCLCLQHLELSSKNSAQIHRFLDARHFRARATAALRMAVSYRRSTTQLPLLPLPRAVLPSWY
jgi:hypothetical protein